MQEAQNNLFQKFNSPLVRIVKSMTWLLPKSPIRTTGIKIPTKGQKVLNWTTTGTKTVIYSNNNLRLSCIPLNSSFRDKCTTTNSIVQGPNWNFPHKQTLRRPATTLSIVIFQIRSKHSKYSPINNQLTNYSGWFPWLLSRTSRDQFLKPHNSSWFPPINHQFLRNSQPFIHFEEPRFNFLSLGLVEYLRDDPTWLKLHPLVSCEFSIHFHGFILKHCLFFLRKYDI